MAIENTKDQMDIKAACDAISAALMIITEYKYFTTRVAKLEAIQEINKFPKPIYDHIYDMIVCHSRA